MNAAGKCPNKILNKMARFSRTSVRRYARLSRSATRFAKKAGPRRRYTAKRRAYRKNPAMSKKRILNITSRKKRNGMQTITTSGANGTPITPAYGPTFINGADGGLFLWCATAITNTSGSNANPISADSGRTADTCFMRGLSEHIRLQTNSPAPWFWRRICFTTRGSVFRLGLDSSPTNTVVPYYDDAARGVQRWAQNMTNNNAPLTVSAWLGVLFKGSESVDWSDRIIAPVDTARVDLKFDKTWTLLSGNAVGIVKERKLWHPMNKNLQYDEDESGETETSSYYSVTDKRGMGDYYVIDIIQAGTGATTTDRMQLTYNSTLYWHEK